MGGLEKELHECDLCKAPRSELYATFIFERSLKVCEGCYEKFNESDKKSRKELVKSLKRSTYPKSS